MLLQQTIKRETSIEGIGLHSGRNCTLFLKPAPVDTGIVFVRDGVHVRASFDHVSDTLLATSLHCRGKKIRTVEHLLSALSGLRIHNLLIEVHGPELPILDGSAMPFVEALLGATIVCQGKPQPYVKILKPVVYGEGSAYVMALPGPGQRVSCRLNFNHPAIQEESLDVHVNPASFARDIAMARTFGFLKDIDALRQKGLAMGGSMENAIVLGDDCVLNEEGLRCRDEFVRHKALDLIGDLSLFGCPIEGHIVTNESGHRLHVAFLRHLACSQNSWTVSTGSGIPAQAPAFAIAQEVAA